MEINLDAIIEKLKKLNASEIKIEHSLDSKTKIFITVKPDLPSEVVTTDRPTLNEMTMPSDEDFLLWSTQENLSFEKKETKEINSDGL